MNKIMLSLQKNKIMWFCIFLFVVYLGALTVISDDSYYGGSVVFPDFKLVEQYNSSKYSAKTYAFMYYWWLAYAIFFAAVIIVLESMLIMLLESEIFPIPTMIIFSVLYCGISALVGKTGKHKKIGYGGTFLLSILHTPIMGYVYTLFSKDIYEEENNFWNKLWVILGIAITLAVIARYCFKMNLF